MKIFLVLILLLSSLAVAGVEKLPEKTAPKKDETVEEFKSSKFLQVDEVTIPRELKIIEDQLVQNAIDVIILIGGHSIVYSQKNDQGYTELYKHFYGLRITMESSPTDPEFYDLRLHYYNWTTTKYDKRLSNKISKFNVLNEIRFALYELFKGKKFVKEHKEEIEKENYNRILSIRESIAKERIEEAKRKAKKAPKETPAPNKEEVEKEKERLKRQMEEEERQAKKAKQSPPEEPASTPTSSPKMPGEEVEKETPDQLTPNKKITPPTVSRQKPSPKKAKEKKAATVSPPATPKEAVAQEPPGTTTPGYKTITFYRLRTGFQTTKVETSNLVKVSTNVTSLVLGGNYVYEVQYSFPLVVEASLLAGMPIKKENYPIPVSKDLSLLAGFKNLFSYFSIHGGLEYTSVDFVNLPYRAAQLQVIKTELILGSLGVGFALPHKNHPFESQFFFVNGLVSKCNFPQDVAVGGFKWKNRLTIHDNHAIEAQIQSYKIAGSYTGSTTSLAFLYNYALRN